MIESEFEICLVSEFSGTCDEDGGGPAAGGGSAGDRVAAVVDRPDGRGVEEEERIGVDGVLLHPHFPQILRLVSSLILMMNV